MRGAVASRWRQTILVCGKCSKKVAGGFGPKGRTPLVKLLRERLDLPRGRKAAIGLVETGCLKLCPKGRVVALDAARPGEWHLLKPGMATAELMETLGIDG